MDSGYMQIRRDPTAARRFAAIMARRRRIEHQQRAQRVLQQKGLGQCRG